ncbi:hypothetical protein EDE10_1307 [Bradyrhizobium sp. Y-H1]|nr:hypothetical protein EDE10_1307 [Bradyrhizobium sp. Y-H1]
MRGRRANGGPSPLTRRSAPTSPKGEVDTAVAGTAFIAATIARGKADHQGARCPAVDSTYENPDLAGPGLANSNVVWLPAGSGYRADAGPHQADAVEVGLLTGVFLGALAGLVALVQELDLLQFLEGLGQGGLGFVELALQLIG